MEAGIEAAAAPFTGSAPSAIEAKEKRRGIVVAWWGARWGAARSGPPWPYLAARCRTAAMRR